MHIWCNQFKYAPKPKKGRQIDQEWFPFHFGSIIMVFGYQQNGWRKTTAMFFWWGHAWSDICLGLTGGQIVMSLSWLVTICFLYLSPHIYVYICLLWSAEFYKECHWIYLSLDVEKYPQISLRLVSFFFMDFFHSNSNKINA